MTLDLSDRTSAAIIYAYCVRFFAIAQGAADAAMGRVSPNLAKRGAFPWAQPTTNIERGLLPTDARISGLCCATGVRGLR